MSEAILIVSPDRKIININRACHEMFGYTLSELQEHSTSLLHVDEAHFKEFGEIIEKGFQDGDSITLEFRARRKNGEIFETHHQVKRLTTPEGESLGILSVIQDVTEKKHIERHMVQSEKLISIGTLASGVAHEINNPVSILQLLIEEVDYTLLDPNPDINSLRENLTRQRKALSRIANIVNGLRSYTRISEETQYAFSLKRSLDETVDIIKNIFAKDSIEIDINLKNPNLTLFGNRGRFQQVLVNLFTNAKDAILETETGGKIKVAARLQSKKIVLNVSNLGKAIPADKIPRIFDAFYTSKPTGKGTGLGLFICHSIVAEMQGKISVISDEVNGTTFTLVFPAADPKGKSGPQANNNCEDINSLRLTGRVLIVDDEKDICETLAKQLEKIGLEVKTALAGRKALAALAKERFDVLITDMLMPQMSGRELLLQAQSLNLLQRIKVLVITGGLTHSFTSEERESIKDMADGFLSKPFNFQDICETLCKLLDQE
jgi:PAS domain S-box-containing protein